MTSHFFLCCPPGPSHYHRLPDDWSPCFHACPPTSSPQALKLLALASEKIMSVFCSKLPMVFPLRIKPQVLKKPTKPFSAELIISLTSPTLSPSFARQQLPWHSCRLRAFALKVHFAWNPISLHGGMAQVSFPNLPI